MSDVIQFQANDGRTWNVSLDNPGRVLAVSPDVENSGANLPEHAIQIIFESGDTTVTEEYTAMTPLEDLSDDDLQEWLDAALEGEGV